MNNRMLNASRAQELRTPVNAIIGYTGNLLMGVPGPLNSEQEGQLKLIQSSARDLLAAIGQLTEMHGAALEESSNSHDFRARFALAGHLSTLPADAIEPGAVVFVIDDEKLIRGAVAALIEKAGFEVQAFASAEDFLASYTPSQANCLVLDIVLPGISGLELLAALRSQKLDIPAIIVTGHGDVPKAVDAMKFHVTDFLQKPADPQVLLEKVSRALEMDSANRRDKREKEAIRKRLSVLSARERELVSLLVMGKSSKEIASDLRISVKTVTNHRAHLMAKTRAQNLADLVRMSMIASEK